jgi:hypothetical protein
MTRLSISLNEPLPKVKSKSAQITDLLPEIEAALSAGHSHTAIFENIKNAIGLDVTFGYYKNTIHRIRRRRDVKNITVEVPLPLHRSKQVKEAVGSVKVVPTIAAPMSKAQEILLEPIDDFFS